MKTMLFIEKLFKFTCKDVNPLISEALDHSLSFGNQVRLKIHLAICKVCRRYQEQIKLVRDLCRKFKGDPLTPSKVFLNDSIKDKIKQELKNYH